MARAPLSKEERGFNAWSRASQPDMLLKGGWDKGGGAAWPGYWGKLFWRVKGGDGKRGVSFSCTMSNCRVSNQENRGRNFISLPLQGGEEKNSVKFVQDIFCRWRLFLSARNRDEPRGEEGEDPCFSSGVFLSCSSSKQPPSLLS